MTQSKLSKCFLFCFLCKNDYNYMTPELFKMTILHFSLKMTIRTQIPSATQFFLMTNVETNYVSISGKIRDSKTI